MGHFFVLRLTQPPLSLTAIETAKRSLPRIIAAPAAAFALGYAGRELIVCEDCATEVAAHSAFFHSQIPIHARVTG